METGHEYCPPLRNAISGIEAEFIVKPIPWLMWTGNRSLVTRARIAQQASKTREKDSDYKYRRKTEVNWLENELKFLCPPRNSVA